MICLPLLLTSHPTHVAGSLEENGVITECSIKTLEAAVLPEINIRDAEIPSNIIMKSDWLAEVFSDLDTSSDALDLTISPVKPYFRITTRGQGGTTQIDCPKDSDVVESFTCGQTMQQSYKLKLLKPSEKALALSTKTSVGSSLVRCKGYVVVRWSVAAAGASVPSLFNQRPPRSASTNAVSCRCSISSKPKRNSQFLWNFW